MELDYNASFLIFRLDDRYIELEKGKMEKAPHRKCKVSATISFHRIKHLSLTPRSNVKTRGHLTFPLPSDEDHNFMEARMPPINH